MKKGIQVGLMTARTLRLIIAVILSVVFGRLGSASGQTETNLYSFGGSPDDGTVPHAGLVQGSDGNFYGTTLKGGTNGVGTVFRISANGGYSNLYSFVGSGNDGANPWAGLFQGSDGNFYGTTEFGGTNGGGTVFRISPSGSYTNLYSIGGSRNDGSAPDAGLVQGSDGNFYGTTSGGGANNNGTVFRISPSGSYTNLHSFNLFNSTNGSEPDAGLVQGSNGNFYGTTSGGGTNGRGTVFRISPSGGYTNLYSFAGPNDGWAPYAGLAQGSDGNFYGTTYSGGTNGNGTVFRISASGSYTNLYSFGSHPNDGIWPKAGLVQGSDGNFYGTTFGGGIAYGTVFRISPSGSYTNLYSFAFSPDGATPWAGLVQGSDGNFYGTTYSGGASNDGTVFRISPNGSYTNLYSFAGPPNDGELPPAGLVQGSDGNFYGTTYFGGAGGGGTVFRISASGSYTNLYSFAGPPNDGVWPKAGLVQGSDGNFYGTTTAGGGTNGCSCGTVFRISPSGTETTLYSFGSSPTDGNLPFAGLVQGSDGNFYGTTAFGGTNSYGTVFSLFVPLNPPANQISGIQLFSVFDTMDVAVQIPSVSGETYQLQYSDSLSPVNWLNTGGTITSIGGPLILTDFAESLPSQRFYRAVITP